jgi:hypothetical protein
LLFSEALGGQVSREIEYVAETGFRKLIIKMGEGFLLDQTVTQRLVNLVKHALQLSLSVRLVVDSRESRNILNQYAETADIPKDLSLEYALNSMR